MQQVTGDPGAEALQLVREIVTALDNPNSVLAIGANTMFPKTAALLARARTLANGPRLVIQPSFELRRLMGANSSPAIVRVTAETTSGRALVLDMSHELARELAGVVLEKAAPL